MEQFPVEDVEINHPSQAAPPHIIGDLQKVRYTHAT